MSPFGCVREREVAALLERGQWPHACPHDLCTHIESCRVCSDLVLVRRSFQQARATAIAEPTLPSAGAIWWRAQLRRRNEALTRISRPILGAEIFAVVILSLAAVCGLLWRLSRGFDLSASLGSWLTSLHLSALWPASLTSFAGGLSFVVPVLAALAVVSGLVVYFASEKQ